MLANNIGIVLRPQLVGDRIQRGFFLMWSVMDKGLAVGVIIYEKECVQKFR